MDLSKTVRRMGVKHAGESAEVRSVHDEQDSRDKRWSLGCRCWEQELDAREGRLR